MFCEGSELDVRELLLYLSADPEPKMGLYKALSLVTGTNITSQQVPACVLRIGHFP